MIVEDLVQEDTRNKGMPQYHYLFKLHTYTLRHAHTNIHTHKMQWMKFHTNMPMINEWYIGQVEKLGEEDNLTYTNKY